MGGMSDAKTVGMRICDRISPEGLAFIRRMDPDLYAEIRKKLIQQKKEAKQEPLSAFLG